MIAILTGALVAFCWRTRARGWALAAVPAIVGFDGILITRHAEPMFPLGDIAVIELYVRNAVKGELLVGPYSRFGWHHPGPACFYLIAPFYAAGGRLTASLAAGAAAMALACVALLAWLAARTTGSRTGAALLLASIALLWRAPGLTVSAWNPHIIVLPTMALIVAAAGAMGGDVAVLPVIAAIASFVAQSDVALVPLAAVTGAFATIGAMVSARRENRRSLLRALTISAWVVSASWLVPVVQELTRSPGNLTLVWRFFVDGHGPGQTWTAAAGAWGTMLVGIVSPGFDLATGGLLDVGSSGVIVAAAVLELCALAGVAWLMWRRDRALARLAALSLATSIVALWSATRIEGGIMDHEVFWIAGLGAVNIGCIAAAAIALAQPHFSERIPRFRWDALVNGLAIAAVMTICGGQLDRARQGRLPVTTNNPVVERLTRGVRQYLEREGAHKALVQIGENDWGFTAGVLLDLDRGGVALAVERDWMPMFPESFAAKGDEDAVIAFGNGDEHEQRMHIPGATAIASFAPLYIDGLPRR